MNTIESIINVCVDFNNKKINNKEFDKFLSELNIYKRLSLYKKSMLVNMALDDLDNLNLVSGTEGDISADVESIYVIRFILSYIETEYEFYPINGDDIETMYESGLIDYILDKCERDYDIIKRMFDNATKFKYLNLFNSMLGDITADKNAENVDKIAKIFEDKETISKVVDIMQYNDPAMKEIKDEIFKPLEKEMRK